MMIKFSDFRKCKSDPPTENGMYLVMHFCMWDGGQFRYAQSLDYTVEHGWNTTPDCPNWPLQFSDEYVWASVSLDSE